MENRISALWRQKAPSLRSKWQVSRGVWCGGWCGAGIVVWRWDMRPQKRRRAAALHMRRPRSLATPGPRCNLATPVPWFPCPVL